MAKKFCLYSPYIPKHFGGGERYLFKVAQVLAKKGEVSIAISGSGGKKISKDHNQRLKHLYEDFLGEKLAENINFVNSPLGVSGSWGGGDLGTGGGKIGDDFLTKLWWTRQFDVLYYATDGSLFFSLAKRNILHIQFPFKTCSQGWFFRLKLKNWQVKNTNSEFTKKVVEKSWEVKIDEVHYPVMVDDRALANRGGLVGGANYLTKKEKIILHVGRFFKQLHSKRQDVLVDIFGKLGARAEAKGWQLVLLGSVEDEKYLAEIKAKILQEKIKNIKILTKASRAELLGWYGRASIYWHATGVGVDENEYPEKMEHFGISTVEAMSYGCAPVVINKGGQKEIMTGALKEWLWDETQECLEKTLKLIKNNNLRTKIQKLALKRAFDFSREKFEQTVWRMVKSN